MAIFLLCALEDVRCLLPVSAVLEVFRPLPIAAVPDLPLGVLGRTTARGAIVPVVDLSFVVHGRSSPAGRFVLARAGARTLVLAVTAVLGVRSWPSADCRELPPLLRGVRSEVIAGLVARDAEISLLLEPARVLRPPEWEALEARCRS